MSDSVDDQLRDIAETLTALDRHGATETRWADLERRLQGLAQVGMEPKVAGSRVQEILDAPAPPARPRLRLPLAAVTGLIGIIIAVIVIAISVGYLRIDLSNWWRPSPSPATQSDPRPVGSSTARAETSTASQPETSTASQAETPSTDVSRPALNLDLDASPDRAVVPGSPITFTFSVSNIGDTRASKASLWTIVPAGATLGQISDQGALKDNGLIEWQIGDIMPGQVQRRTLVVTVSPDQTTGGTIQLDSYWVQAEGGVEVAGHAQATVAVEARAPDPPSQSSVALTVSPPVLPADGQASATVTATLSGLETSSARDALSITFTLAPPDVGIVQPSVASVQEGVATTTFIAGLRAGQAEITARAGSIFATGTITLTQVTVKTGKLTRLAHLFSGPTDAVGSIIFFQLPVGTPIEFLEGVEGGMQEVALPVWVPRDMIDIESNQQQGNIKVPAPEREVRVGENPEDPLNAKPAKRQVFDGAKGVAVAILDNTNSDFVRVRVEGWMLQASIAED